MTDLILPLPRVVYSVVIRPTPKLGVTGILIELGLGAERKVKPVVRISAELRGGVTQT